MAEDDPRTGSHIYREDLLIQHANPDRSVPLLSGWIARFLAAAFVVIVIAAIASV